MTSPAGRGEKTDENQVIQKIQTRSKEDSGKITIQDGDEITFDPSAGNV
jgi:hypothetical protein